MAKSQADSNFPDYRSYFGGFLCTCWSPDGKYVVCGGEDDLVTVYSMEEKRIVVRGQGHKSWVSVVAFDPFNISYGELPDGLDFSGSDEDQPPSELVMKQKQNPKAASSYDNVTCYRFGSVGQDTMLCLWDLTEDILKQSRSMASSAMTSPVNHVCQSSPTVSLSKDSGLVNSDLASSNSSSLTTQSLTSRLASLNFGDRKDKRISSGRSGSASTSGLGATSSSKNSSQTSLSLPSASNNGYANGVPGEDGADLGCPQCPRINQTPLIEPLVCKKIAHERLTALVFREDCLVTACQDGYVCTWARPGRVVRP